MNLSNWLTFSRDFSTLSSVLVIYGIQVLVTWPDRFLLWLGQNRVGWSFNPWISTSGLCKDDLGLEPSISDPASPNYPKQLESDLFRQHTVLGFLTMSSTPKICKVEVFYYYIWSSWFFARDKGWGKFGWLIKSLGGINLLTLTRVPSNIF